MSASTGVVVNPSALGLKRPEMPTTADQLRSVHQRVRFDLLTHDWEDHLSEFLALTVDPEWLAVVGIPDTSQNALASQTKALVTPGLYGYRPEVSHQDHDNAAPLIGPEGFQDQSLHWSLMQWVQYLAVGMGDWFLRFDVVAEEAALAARHVLPWDTIVRWHPRIPGRIVELRELGIRPVDGKLRYTWDQWCVDPSWSPASEGSSCEPATGGGVGYRIWEATGDGRLGQEVTEAFPDAAGLTGDGYWWRLPEGHAHAGRPFVPVVHYSSRFTANGWNHNEKAALHKGTFRLAQYMTYTGRSALYASGSHVLIFGASPGPVQNRRQEGREGQVDDRGIQSKVITPGMMSFIPKKDGESVQVTEVGPGVNLPNLLDFAATYGDLLAVGEGHAPADVLRRSANPTSGAALVVSDQERRDHAAAVTPVFRPRDLETTRIQAILLNAASASEEWPAKRLTLPTDGYAIVYREIPRAPQEEAQRRDQLTWEKDQGLLSDVDLYIAQHPGVTPEAAEAAIVKVRVTQARLAKLTADALKAAGLEPAPAPPAPPVDDPADDDPPTSPPADGGPE